MWTIRQEVAITPEAITAGLYCGYNYNHIYIATACAYPTNSFKTAEAGGGVANPPLGATVSCGPAVSNMYGIDPEGGTWLDLLAYIIRWEISASYSGYCDLYMTVVDEQNKSDVGGPPVPPPPNLQKMRMITGPDGRIKGYRLPLPVQRGVHVDHQPAFDIFPAKTGDVAHDLEVPPEHAQLLTRNPQDALKRLRLDRTTSTPTLHLD
jgi:hypothetical protein